MAIEARMAPAPEPGGTQGLRAYLEPKTVIMEQEPDAGPIEDERYWRDAAV